MKQNTILSDHVRRVNKVYLIFLWLITVAYFTFSLLKINSVDILSLIVLALGLAAATVLFS